MVKYKYKLINDELGEIMTEGIVIDGIEGTVSTPWRCEICMEEFCTKDEVEDHVIDNHRTKFFDECFDNWVKDWITVDD